MPDHSSDTIPVLLALAGLCRDAGRGDLERVTQRLGLSAGDAAACVAVVGGYQQGKTTLISSLLGVPVAPSGPTGSTAATTLVRNGDAVSVALASDPSKSVPCELEELPDVVRVAWAADTGVPRMAVVDVPSPLLEEGLVLLDTPGSPGFGGGAVAAAISALPVADATILVTAATQPMTAAEVELAAALAKSGRPLIIVATRADLQVEWREVLAANRDALEAVGVSCVVSAVSTPLRMAAMADGDEALDAESGVDVVVDWVFEEVIDPLTRLRRRCLMTDGLGVLSSLREQCTAELRAIDGGAGSDDALRHLEDQARQIQHGASRWGQELTDLMTDLRTSVDADLRTRGMALIEAAAARIDGGDPADDWDAFGGWLEEEMATAMSTHLSWRHDRIAEVVERSAASFGELLSIVRPVDATGNATAVDSRLGATPKKIALGTSLYAVLKNSYGGMMMFGFLGGVAGVVLTAPLTVGLGLVLGSKSYRTERAKQLVARRTQAKTAAKAHIDAVWSAFGNDARTQLRQIQRSVRDELSAAVERLKEDTKTAYERAIGATRVQDQERERRKPALEAHLVAIDQVTARLEALDRPAVAA